MGWSFDEADAGVAARMIHDLMQEKKYHIFACWHRDLAAQLIYSQALRFKVTADNQHLIMLCGEVMLTFVHKSILNKKEAVALIDKLTDGKPSSPEEDKLFCLTSRREPQWCARAMHKYVNDFIKEYSTPVAAAHSPSVIVTPPPTLSQAPICERRRDNPNLN